MEEHPMKKTTKRLAVVAGTAALYGIAAYRSLPSFVQIA